MSQDVTVLTSRRAYEFSIDSLRLTMLSTRPVVQAIQSSLDFQVTGIATPPATFGPVVATQPPGVAFQLGFWTAEEDQLVPIRFLHIEPTRIVIDVAGPSRYIDGIFAALNDVVGRIQAPDGKPVLGHPVRTLDWSEVIIQLDMAPDRWLPKPIQTLMRRAVGLSDSSDGDLVLVPTLMVQAAANRQEYPGLIQMNTQFAHFALRAGSTPEHPVYFSGAPMDSEAHLDYLEAFQRTIAAMGDTDER